MRASVPLVKWQAVPIADADVILSNTHKVKEEEEVVVVVVAGWR